MNIASNILAVSLAVFFVCLGTAKVLALAPTRELAAEVGVPITANRGIGALEVAGAVGLVAGMVWPLLGGLAGVGLLLLLSGAVITHLRKGHRPRKFIAAAVSWLLVAAYLTVHIGALG